jgi:hypothetical protein
MSNHTMHMNRRQQMRIQEFDFSDTGFATGVAFQWRSVIWFRWTSVALIACS